MPVPRPRLLTRLRRFGRSEDGSMVVFGLFIFVMMLIVAGMSVDIMRHETTRTRLQATLDRAVLAAADLDQERDPEEVVRDYFRSAGLLDRLNSVTVTETINSRSVTADADFRMNTMFMDWAGVEELDVLAGGTAEEAVNDIEIVLVLDVSGSMGDPSAGTTKIALLRSAAREFVSTVMAGDTEHRISIAIVPFNAQVNLGPTIFNGMVGNGWSDPTDVDWDIVNLHGIANSFCLDLPDQAYEQASIPHMRTPLLPLELPQAGYFDGVSTTTRSDTAYTAPQAISTGNVFCRTETANIVRLPSQNVTTMRSQLNALSANGNTSITMGMKWANFMLDPSTRPFFTRMVGTGSTRIPEALRGRPFDYDRPNTLKIIVVMTDGEHVSSLYLDPSYRTELSPIYRYGTSTSNYQYSIRHKEGHGYNFYVPHLNIDPSTPASARNGKDDDHDGVADDGLAGAWLCAPWDGTLDGDCDGAAEPDTDTDGTGPVTQLTWNQVWQNVRVSWVAWNLYAKALCPVANNSANNACRDRIYDEWMDTRSSTDDRSGTPPNFMTATEVDDMNTSLQQSCAQAKANRVVVYGIAFEAPPEGEEQIFSCASSPSHFYDAQGLNITTAFRAIAAQINALRLTN